MHVRSWETSCASLEGAVTGRESDLKSPRTGKLGHSAVGLALELADHDAAKHGEDELVQSENDHRGDQVQA